MTVTFTWKCGAPPAGGNRLCWVLLPLLMFLVPPAAPAAEAPPRPMSVSEVKAASPSKEKPQEIVAVEGLVVWSEGAPARFLYLQEHNVGLLVRLPPDAAVPPAGDQVRVRGTLQWSEREVEVLAIGVETLGHPGVPRGKRISIGSMATGAANGTRVHVRGYLRHAQWEGLRLRLTLDSDGVRVSCLVADADGVTEPNDLVGEYAYIDGVASAARGPGSFEVLVPTFDGLYFRKRSGGEAREVVPIRDLFRYRKGYSWGDRVKIRAVVLGVSGGELHVHDGTAGIAIRGIEPSPLAGQWVEAIGFPEFEEGREIFSDATIKPVEPHSTVKPTPATAAELLEPKANHRYVTVSGRLVERRSAWPEEAPGAGEKQDSATTLVLLSDGVVFAAKTFFPGAEARPELGSLLSVTGVCQARAGQGGTPAGFSLLVFSPGGLRVLQGPSFLNERRLLILLCLTLAVLAGTGFLAFLAVRRNSELLATARERRAIHAERNRLAGDLHDTLEQILTAIHLQLHSLGPAASLPAEMRTGVSSIGDLVRQCHLEIRNFVWNLRPTSLERYDLARALERIAQALTLGTSTHVVASTEGSTEGIPPLIEDNLLRLGQEALTNAVKHGRPREIGIRLTRSESSLVLTIADDGAGMAPDVAEGFGLRGMKERVRRIGGAIQIGNQAEGGTRVEVTVPLPGRETPSG